MTKRSARTWKQIKQSQGSNSNDSRFVAAHWEEYRKNVIHPDASPLQIRETRRAFYAGVSIIFEFMEELEACPSKQEGVELLSELEAELRDFLKKIGTEY